MSTTNFQIEVLNMLRSLIGDIDACDYEYSDERLSSLIFVAAFYVNQDLCGDYTISVSSKTISPNPISPTYDKNMVSLTSLKAACLLMNSESTQASKSDFKVMDGPSTVDIEGISGKIRAAADNFCGQYERAKLAILSCEGGYGVITPTTT